MANPKISKNDNIPKFETFPLSAKRNKYCLCIPVINEGEKFKKVLAKIKPYSGLLDILVLDNNSSDGSTDTDFLRKNSVTALLELGERGRLGSQLRMGYYYALNRGYKGVVTIDGNGKDDPVSIPLFLKSLEEGFDYVQGSRFLKGGSGVNTPILRELGIRFIHAPLLGLSSGFWYTDTTPGFRAYSSKLLMDRKMSIFRKVFQSYELLAYISARAPRLGFKVKEVPIIRKYPKGGTVPTKIHGFEGNLELLTVLLKSALGCFNPS